MELTLVTGHKDMVTHIDDGENLREVSFRQAIKNTFTVSEEVGKNHAELVMMRDDLFSMGEDLCSDTAQQLLNQLSNEIETRLQKATEGNFTGCNNIEEVRKVFKALCNMLG